MQRDLHLWRIKHLPNIVRQLIAKQWGKEWDLNHVVYYEMGQLTQGGVGPCNVFTERILIYLRSHDFVMYMFQK